MSEAPRPTQSRKQRDVLTLSADPGRWARSLEARPVRLHQGLVASSTPIRFCHDRHVRVGAEGAPGEHTWPRELSRDVLRVKEMPWVVLADPGLLVMRGPGLTWIFRSLATGGNHGQARAPGRLASEVALSPRGDRLWLFHGDPRRTAEPRTWSAFVVPSGELVAEGELPAGLSGVAFGRDGSRMAVATDDGWVRVLACEDFTELAAFGIESAWGAAALALSPTGEQVATARRDAGVGLWRADDGGRAGEMGDELGWRPGESLVFPDSRTLAAGAAAGLRTAALPEPPRPREGATRPGFALADEDLAPDRAAWPRLAERGLAPRPGEVPGAFWVPSARTREHQGLLVEAGSGWPLGCWRLADGAPMVLVLGDDGSPSYLDRFPVTVEQFARFLAARGGQPPDAWEDQLLHPRRPVVFVDHPAAAAFCRWAGAALPDEALWERAARGEDGRRFPWAGGEGEAPVANYQGAGPGALTDVDAHPAGASPFGLEDMAGNAAEWCCDAYPLDRLEDPERLGRVDPLGPPCRVAKGGAFTEGWLALRASARVALPEQARLRWVGFRAAIPLAPGSGAPGR